MTFRTTTRTAARDRVLRPGGASNRRLPPCLTRQGWTHAEYADWIERTAVAELLGDTAQKPQPYPRKT